MPAGTDEPYAPILQALRPTLAALSDDDLITLLGPSAEDHLRLMPELHVRLARAGAVPVQPSVTSAERRQARLLEGILGVLGRLGTRRPVMLVLEDLHHADAARAPSPRSSPRSNGHTGSASSRPTSPTS